MKFEGYDPTHGGPSLLGLQHFRQPRIRRKRETQSAKRSEPRSDLRRKALRLLPGGEVSALGELIVVNQFRIRLLCPTPRGWIEFVREHAHGDRDGDALGVEIAFAKIFPVKAGAGKRRVRQPGDRDVVEDVVARKALGLALKDARGVYRFG
jgi:hypothetical protein